MHLLLILFINQYISKNIDLFSNSNHLGKYKLPYFIGLLMDINPKQYRDKIHQQFTLGYVTHKIDNDEKTPKVFAFPPSRQGFETVKNKRELSNLLKMKFREMFPSPEMKYSYEITQSRGLNVMREQEHRLTAHCRICTNNIVYVKKMFGESEYRLIKMGEYHVHGKDPYKVQQMRRRTQNHSRWTLRLGRPYEVKPIYIDQKTDTSIEEFIKCLPVEITNSSRCRIVCDRFKITKIEYENVMRSIRAEYEITLRQLFDRFSKKNYTYRFLPENIIDINQEWIANKKINEYLASIKHYDCPDQHNVHQIDKVNPDIPNVLLIITPQMRELYHKYGQYIGFDLTFSLIRQKPEHSKEYLVGVMAGTSESRRILVYGLVITNNQSEYVYKYIFREFIKIMGKCPETIVTDEQMSLHYALDSLRMEGLFTGKHLLDMFHVLKKFRKSCESTTFQLFRKMMHSKDRQEYRRYLEEAMLEVSNDDELQVLRNFDYNSERYCYSQTEASFVGIGISDSMNEKYHDLIKAQLPYETKYIKAINIILDLIESRNQLNRYGIIDKNPVEQKMSMPFMKPYRTVLSDKIFHYLLKEVCKSLPYVILTDHEDRKENLKIEEGNTTAGLINRDKYIVRTNLGLFTVYKHYEKGVAINEQKSSKEDWRCHCEFEEKSGYLCSHLAKVLITLRLDFFDNLHPRWIIRQDQIEEGMKKFIFRERKFHYYSRIRMRKFPKWNSPEDGEKGSPRSTEYQQLNESDNSDNSMDEQSNESSFAYGNKYANESSTNENFM